MKTLTLAVAAALAFGIANSSAVAQSTPTSKAAQYGVAVVDISKIFEEHQAFKALMEQMKADMQKVDAQMKAKRDALIKMEEARNSFKPGTAEYRQKDDELARAKATFALEMDRLSKSLMERESSVYFQTYQQISSVIGQYAKQQNIGLVLKYSSAEPDPSSSADILKHINKPVVYSDGIDITQNVLAILNRGASNGASATALRPGQTRPQ
ncbi:OmpH family outer membrane protein [Aeoliella mucimassa]|uniref:Outer membrane protein (OmpH-like) n=1 Tax=Aeoliella mucimassa TaxID=2527972 RepID=A0A518ARC5_9BACT|nr:OmpH family outer membrane protein [Aeoliella mucimassa]QDU57266.1 Outer membrane protein (OmpH-like) [Aeoliella mucimassa]